jgi:hypothetical protein
LDVARGRNADAPRRHEVATARLHFPGRAARRRVRWVLSTASLDLDAASVAPAIDRAE